MKKEINYFLIMKTTYPERPAPSFELWLVWIKRERQVLALVNEANEAIEQIYKHLNK